MCSSIHNDITSQVFVIIILTIAAAESAIGLAIFFAYFKKKKSVAVKDANLLKG
jgi:NADH-quinone oxidoreductase subunit K